MIFSKVKEFIVYFEADNQIIQVKKTDILLEDFEDYSWKDWDSVPSGSIHRFKVVYQGDIYESVLFQVVNSSIDTTESIELFRHYVKQKRLNITSLLKIIPRTRELCGKRAKMVFLNVSYIVLKVYFII